MRNKIGGSSKLLLTVTILLVTISQQVDGSDLECLRGWIGHADSCYKFVRSNYAHFSNATSYCETYNSKLLSVNDFDENTFIIDWLRNNDPHKRLWLTSALVSYGQNNWQWAGDLSKFISNNDLWLTTNTNSYYDRLSSNGAAYSYSPAESRWGLIRVDPNRSNYSFICEFLNTLSNNIGNKYLNRELDYGYNVQNLSLVPRGPKIVVEPKDVVFDLSGRTHSNQLKLRCVADGYPEPSYVWYREDRSLLGIVGSPIDPLADDRVTQTDGTLIIFNPNQQSDKGKYYCAASNEYGKVISQTVSITFGFILEFSKKRSIEIGKENWGKSISCDAPTHQPKALYYWTKSELVNFVQQDRRVFISHDGNLYFSSLEKIDRANYSCQIQSLISSTGRFGPPFPLVVEPASNAQKLQIASGFPKIFPEAPLAGQNIRLECMAYGYPTPSYNWSRVGVSSQLPRGYTIKNDGKVLEIAKARIDDEGEYVCKASSEGETHQKSIRISIQAAPSFTQPLEDLVLGEREMLVWECEAFGLPKVGYTWFRNGEELVMANLSPLDQARYTIRDNKFVIDSVQRDRDAGMYQCRASNQHGTAFSSAQLRVANLRPMADKNFTPITIHAMVDQNVTLPCNVEAIPKPVISWRKEGQPLEDRSRVRVLANGQLLISRVRTSDLGGYECVAENQLGSLTIKSWLLVKPAPLILDPLPRREIVKYGDPIKIINCDVQSDYSMEVAQVWLKNGQPIKFDEPASRYSKTETGQLVIRNVSYLDQANYTCQARTAIGLVERSGSLMVRGPPDACGAVSADSLSQSSARVWWTDGADHLSRVIHNTIEGRTNHNQTWTVLAANVTGQLGRAMSAASVLSAAQNSGGNQFSRKSYLLSNLLLPWSIYEFRVSATNDLGRGPPSEASPKYRTEMSAPRFAVTNVRGGGGKAGSLLVRWDALPVWAWGANEIWYQLYYRQNGSLEWTKRELSTANGHTDAHTINLSGDIFYKPFEVMVQPINSLGAGPVSQIAVVYSAQQMPRLQPTNVYALAHNSTALNVSWNGVSELEQAESGRLIGYRIRYWPVGKDPQTHSLTYLKRGLDSWALLVGLQPDSEYHVTVMAYNEAGSGPESESFRARTFKWAPQRAPTSVSAQLVDETSVTVSYRGVTQMSTNEEPVLGYKVRYWRQDEPMSQARDIVKRLDDGAQELSVIIRDLVPGETYKVRVLAFSSGGDGKMSSPELFIKVDSLANGFGATIG